MNKLIVWDFDGVIADTEHVSMRTWRKTLKEFGINWSFDETAHNILGTGQNKQLELLRQYNEKLTIEDVKYVHDVVNRTVQKDIELTDGIEDIFKMRNFAQCIATGNAPEGIEARVRPLDLGRYFPESTLFSASFVAHGKPDPDLFLYAADKMGFEPKDCVVVEDSYAGLTAGLRAGMTTIAFTQHAVIDKDEYVSNIKSLGVKYIFNDMSEVKKFLESL